jgi:hypothetical protein
MVTAEECPTEAAKIVAAGKCVLASQTLLRNPSQHSRAALFELVAPHGARRIGGAGVIAENMLGARFPSSLRSDRSLR